MLPLFLSIIFLSTLTPLTIGIIHSELVYGYQGPYRVEVSTDKTVYHPGEKVMISGRLGCNCGLPECPGPQGICADHECSNPPGMANLKIMFNDPTGKTVITVTDVHPENDGSYDHSITLPENVPPGEYTMTIGANIEEEWSSNLITFKVEESPVEIPVETPTETPTETPVEPSEETPAETPLETTTETLTETPTETPIEITTEAPHTDYTLLYITIMILSLLGAGLIFLQAAPGRAKGKKRKTITKADLKHAIDQGKQKQFISPEKLKKEHPELKTEKDRADKVKEIWRDAAKDSGERYSLEQAIKILEKNRVNLEQKEKLLDKEKKKIIDDAQKDFEKHLEKLSKEEGVPVEELRKQFTVETSEEHKKTIKEYDKSIQNYQNRIKERDVDSEKNKDKLETVIKQQKKRFSTYGVFGDPKLEEKANALLAWSNGKMNLKWSLEPKGMAGRGLAWKLDTALDLSAIPSEYRRELIHNLKVVVKGKSGKDVTVTQGGDYRDLNEAAPNTTGVIMEPKVGTTEFIWYPLPGNVAFWYLEAQGKKLRKDIRDEDLSIPFRQLFHIHLPTALDAKDVNFEFWADDPRTPETDRILIGKVSIPQKEISKASKGGKKSTGLQNTTIKNMIKP